MAEERDVERDVEDVESGGQYEQMDAGREERNTPVYVEAPYEEEQPVQYQGEPTAPYEEEATPQYQGEQNELEQGAQTTEGYVEQNPEQMAGVTEPVATEETYTSEDAKTREQNKNSKDNATNQTGGYFSGVNGRQIAVISVGIMVLTGFVCYLRGRRMT